LTRTAGAWAELMQRLNYRRYVAQGGDLGAGVTTRMAKARPSGLEAVHLNFPLLFSPLLQGEPTDGERSALAQLQKCREKAAAYSFLQKTRPQTLGYALADSPTGQAAWIYEKFLEWSGNDSSHRDVLSGKPSSINPLNVIFRGLTIKGFWLGHPDFKNTPVYHDALRESARLVAEGKLQAPVAATYPIARFSEALAHAKSGGKVLLDLRSSGVT